MMPLRACVIGPAHRFCVLLSRSALYALCSSSSSEFTPEGKRVTKLDSILLNGNNIALLVPGGAPDAK